MVTPKNRPDYKFWMTHWTQRPHMLDEEYFKILADLEEYSCARFSMGKRFTLVKQYNSIPLGTRCTVTKLWPQTTVRWDKWSRSGWGSTRQYSSNVLFELDMCLDYV